MLENTAQLRDRESILCRMEYCRGTGLPLLTPALHPIQCSTTFRGEGQEKSYERYSAKTDEEGVAWEEKVWYITNVDEALLTGLLTLFRRFEKPREGKTTEFELISHGVVVQLG